MLDRHRPEHKALAALVAVAVVVLLCIGISRSPTRRERAARAGSQSAQPGAAGGSQSQSRNSLIETELYSVQARNLSLKYNDVPLQISFLAAEPNPHIVAKAPAVLLLHAHEHSSRIWEQLGTLQLVAEMGHQAFAIDLPGAGDTRVKGKLPHADFLQAVIDSLSLDRPLLVAASTAGHFAFDFAFDDSPTVGERLSGLILLSPAGALTWRHEDFVNLRKVYTVLIRGGKEDPLGEEAAKRLQRVPTVKMVQEPSAGHLHFAERPDILHDAVAEALKHLED